MTLHGDWSSDVCSSDLGILAKEEGGYFPGRQVKGETLNEYVEVDGHSRAGAAMLAGDGSKRVDYDDSRLDPLGLADDPPQDFLEVSFHDLGTEVDESDG